MARNYKFYSVNSGLRSYLLGKKTDSNIDHYPKILLTLDMDLEADFDGITKMNVVVGY